MDPGENWKLDETNWLSHGGIHPFASVKGGRTRLLFFNPSSECVGNLPDVLLPPLCLQWSQGCCWAVSRATQYLVWRCESSDPNCSGLPGAGTLTQASNLWLDFPLWSGLLPKKLKNTIPIFCQAGMPLVLGVTTLILHKQDPADDSGQGRSEEETW